jgi:hypothetical protein
MHLASVKNNVIFDTQDIFVGGTDTTTTMIEWTMARLMQHQEVRQKVYQELQEVVGANNVCFSNLSSCLKFFDSATCMYKLFNLSINFLFYYKNT